MWNSIVREVTRQSFPWIHFFFILMDIFYFSVVFNSSEQQWSIDSILYSAKVLHSIEEIYENIAIRFAPFELFTR